MGDLKMSTDNPAYGYEAKEYAGLRNRESSNICEAKGRARYTALKDDDGEAHDDQQPQAYLTV